MPNYQNGKIYALRSYQTDDIYIGSTTQTLAVRKGGHKRDYKNFLNDKCSFISSFNIIKYEDCYIELIELYACDSRCELEAREGYHIRKNNCVNKRIAGRNKKQYYEENKDKISIKHKQYYEDNREMISQKKNEKHICICGSTYTHQNKKRHERSKKHQAFINC